MKRIQVMVEDWQEDYLGRWSTTFKRSAFIRACLCYVIANNKVRAVTDADFDALDFNARKEVTK